MKRYILISTILLFCLIQNSIVAEPTARILEDCPDENPPPPPPPEDDCAGIGDYFPDDENPEIDNPPEVDQNPPPPVVDQNPPPPVVDQNPPPPVVDQNPPPPVVEQNPKPTTPSSSVPATGCTVKTAKPGSYKAFKNDVNKAALRGDCLYRSNTPRRSLKLPDLKWDDGLAKSAQQWAQNMADNTVFKHSCDYGKVGENIAQTTKTGSTLKSLFDVWTGEKKSFTKGAKCSKFGTCKSKGKDVSHYSQMVWKESQKVGCGFANGKKYNYLVCQYWPRGTLAGKAPY